MICNKDENALPQWNKIIVKSFIVCEIALSSHSRIQMYKSDTIDFLSLCESNIHIATAFLKVVNIL